jgi:hypothetical protein
MRFFRKAISTLFTIGNDVRFQTQSFYSDETVRL